MSWEEQFLAKKGDGRLGTFPQIVGSASNDSDLYNLLSGFKINYGTPTGFQQDRNVLILDGGNYNHANIILSDGYVGASPADIATQVFHFGGYVEVGTTNAAGTTISDLQGINVEGGESLLSSGADVPSFVEQTAPSVVSAPRFSTTPALIGAGGAVALIALLFLLSKKRRR